MGDNEINLTFHASPPSQLQAPRLSPTFHHHPPTNYSNRKSPGFLGSGNFIQEQFSETSALLSPDSSISDQQEVKEAYLMRYFVEELAQWTATLLRWLLIEPPIAQLFFMPYIQPRQGTSLDENTST
ncbi:hypothetical protein N7528_003392 [Penicillium herquei]|nr:hypothetical protein N7528_003392 [Penicillium herquei]